MLHARCMNQKVSFFFGTIRRSHNLLQTTQHLSVVVLQCCACLHVSVPAYVKGARVLPMQWLRCTAFCCAIPGTCPLRGVKIMPKTSLLHSSTDMMFTPEDTVLCSTGIRLLEFECIGAFGHSMTPIQLLCLFKGKWPNCCASFWKYA